MGMHAVKTTPEGVVVSGVPEAATKTFADDPMQLHPAQLGNGVVQFYRQFQRAELSYRVVHAFIHQKGRMPVLSASVGDGTTLEFDLNAYVRRITDSQEKQSVLTRMMAPWANYLVQEIRLSLQRLAEFCHNAITVLDVEEQPGAWVPVHDDFDKVVEELHAAFSEYEPRWLVYSGYLLELDEPADGEKPEMQVRLPDGAYVPLSDLLACAGLSGEDAVKKAADRVKQARMQALSKELYTCLIRLKAAAEKAMQIATQ